MATEQFHFTSESGTKITLPRATQIKFSILRTVRHMNDIDALFEFLDVAGDQKAIDQIDNLTIAEGTKLAEEWLAELGETQGSSNSSRS